MRQEGVAVGTGSKDDMARQDEIVLGVAGSLMPSNNPVGDDYEVLQKG